MKLEAYIENFKTIYLSLSTREKELAKVHIIGMLQYHKYDVAFVKSFFLHLEQDMNVLVFLQNHLAHKKLLRFLKLAQSKLEESFTLEENNNKESSVNPAYQVKFSISKSILILEFFNRKGLQIAFQSLLENKIKEATKYQEYQKLANLQNLKRTRLVNNISSKLYNKLCKEIEKNEYKAKAVQKVGLSYDTYINKNFNKVGLAINELKKAYKVTKYYKKKTDSILILSYYYLIQVDLFDVQKRKLKQRKALLKLIQLVLNHNLLYSKARLTKLYSMLSYCELKLFNFLKALEAVKKSIAFSSGMNSIFYYQSVTLELHILVILNRKEELGKLINSLENFRKTKVYKFRIELVNYIEALYHLSLFQHEEGVRLLQDISELNKDKVGYNPWIRIYRILCLIELKEYEKVEKEGESFRKYVERLEEEEQLSRRILTIIQLFSILRKVGYQFSHLKIRTSKELAQLSSLDEAYIWNPDSPELILIHDWFWAKIERRDYAPNLERYRKGNLA